MTDCLDHVWSLEEVIEFSRVRRKIIGIIKAPRSILLWGLLGLAFYFFLWIIFPLHFSKYFYRMFEFPRDLDFAIEMAKMVLGIVMALFGSTWIKKYPKDFWAFGIYMAPLTINGFVFAFYFYARLLVGVFSK